MHFEIIVAIYGLNKSYMALMISQKKRMIREREYTPCSHTSYWEMAKSLVQD